jgi:hypothetical protein
MKNCNKIELKRAGFPWKMPPKTLISLKIPEKTTENSFENTKRSQRSTKIRKNYK